MTVVSGLELPLEESLFFEEQGGALRRPSMQDAARTGLARARDLVEPKLVYDFFPVELLEHNRAEVGGIVFKLGRHAELLVPARLAFLGLVTIGARLEAQSRELQTAGKALEAYMLDAAGIFAVGLVMQQARHIAERAAADRGWGVGAELAPGQLSGWPITEHLLVAGLLPLAEIGVSVTEYGVLVPQKSASLMVGIGPDYESTEVRSPCEYCDVAETCRFHH